MSEGDISPLEAGREYDFFGVDNCRMKLDGRVYEAMEDPDDGYRSYFGTIEIRDDAGVFFKTPLDRVRLQEAADGADDFTGWRLVSVTDGHQWLRFGTQDISDYYPGFIFEYTPRSLKTEDGG